MNDTDLQALTAEYIPHPAEDYRPRPEVRARSEVPAPDGPLMTGFVMADKGEPKYKLMAYMAATGKTREDIANAIGMSKSWVTQVFKQPWFKKNVDDLLRENGASHIQAFLQSEVMPSLEVVREIRDDEKVLASTRLAAASSLLDRFLGKPQSKVEVSGSLNLGQVDGDIDAITRELRAIDEKLTARGVTVVAANLAGNS